ncbi:MAG: outer membrane beta-barrel protein [Myxococcota bacterium]
MTKVLSIAVACGLAFPAMALAQDVMVEEDVETVVVDTVETTDPPPTPAIEEVPPPKVAADDMTEEYAGDEPAEESSLIDGLSWQIMASAFYNFNGYRRSGTYNNLGYPYTNYMGFGVNFVGGMVAYTGEKWGVVVDLRWGTGAPLLTPLNPVKQGYASWLPTEKLSIDVGFFDTIYGAEVADEWENANYSRGALYFLRQPFNHMGVRMGTELSDAVGFTFMVTNGGVLGGTPVDLDNQVPALGWQFSFAPGDVFGLYIGGNHAPSSSNENKDWEHFFDVVLSVSVDWFTLLFNGDYQINPFVSNGLLPPENVTAFAFGHSLALIFDVSDKVSIGLRGENLSGNDNQRNLVDSFGGLTTGTITLRYKPAEYLVLSLEGRGEWTTRNTYFSRNAPIETDADGLETVIADRDKYYSIILGISGHIGN